MMALDVTDATFPVVVAASPVPVVLEFYAPWCGNCRRIAPVLDSLAEEFAATVRFAMVDAEQNPGLISRFQVSSTPTLIVWDGGRELTRLIGAQRGSTLRELFTHAAAGTGATEGVGWVPAEACTLSTAGQAQRLTEFEDLFSASLRSTERPAPTWLRLHLADGDGVEAGARDLIARERHCCEFFDFSLHRAPQEIILDVRVPAERTRVLDGLSRQADAAGDRAAR